MGFHVPTAAWRYLTRYDVTLAMGDDIRNSVIWRGDRHGDQRIRISFDVVLWRESSFSTCGEIEEKPIKKFRAGDSIGISSRCTISVIHERMSSEFDVMTPAWRHLTLSDVTFAVVHKSRNWDIWHWIAMWSMISDTWEIIRCQIARKLRYCETVRHQLNFKGVIFTTVGWLCDI